MATTPAGVKAPEDHKTKTEKPNVEHVEIELPDGVDDDGEPKFRTVPARRVVLRDIEVTVPEEALDDFEVLDDIRAVQDNKDGSRLPSLLRRLAGPDEYKKVLEGLRGANGRVSVEDGSKFVLDLFAALAPNS